MKKTLLFLFLLFSLNVFAQMPTDAIYMPKKSLCAAAMYSNSTWSEYWEGTLKRDNPNIGKNITQAYSLMAVYGLSNKLNVIINAPYITTKNSAGNLLGQRGLQDFSAFLKYKAFEIKGLSLNAVVGASLPMSNYVPDFLPMSIGLQCKTAVGRVIANYQHKSGLYSSASTAYSFRSNIKIDRDAYQANGKLYNTNEVEVPHSYDLAFRVGYLKKKFQLEGAITRFSCVKGDNIRRNDMPFPTNNMQATNIGFYAKYQPKNTGVIANVSQTIDGLNVGKSFMLMGGVIYQFNFAKVEGGAK